MTEEKKCVIGEIIEHMIDDGNIWNPEKYVQSRTVNGVSFGKETMVRYQYCRGSAYAEGHVDSQRFQLYYSHLQGFQLHLLDDEVSVTSYPPHQNMGVLMALNHRVSVKEEFLLPKSREPFSGTLVGRLKLG